jgi:hypothetical protein
VRPGRVVLLAPGIDRGLGGGDRGERPGVIQEIGLQGLSQRSTFPVAGGERGLVSSCLMPFLR